MLATDRQCSRPEDKLSEAWDLCCRGDTLSRWATLQIIRPLGSSPMRLWQRMTTLQDYQVSGTLHPPKSFNFFSDACFLSGLLLYSAKSWSIRAGKRHPVVASIPSNR